MLAGLLTVAAGTAAQAAKTSTLTSKFSHYDIDGDGLDEIESLSHLSFENAHANLSSSSKLVLVLVEKRLLEMNASGGEHSKADLVNRLRRLRGDLRAEGLVPRFISADLYDGPKHQDGRTLLALRRMFKDAQKTFPQFQGAILVGSFPEAALVRRWVWRRKDWKVTIEGTEYNCEGCQQSDFLRIVPEMVAHRADLVLADLDGKWESLYVQGPKSLEAIEAIPEGNQGNWPRNGVVFTSTKFNRRNEQFEDFFWIKDDRYEVVSATPTTLKVKTWTAMRHPELASADKSRSNPIARPDIFVSRINARNVARSPDPSFKDKNGKGFLDAAGKPRTIHTHSSIDPKAKLVYDAALERDLVVDYLDRNHAFRVGGNPTSAKRTAAASYGEGLENGTGLNKYLREASGSFASSRAYNKADLRDYVAFLKTPAVLKGVSAHSSEWNSAFDDDYSASGLALDAGGKPWRWKKSSGNTYVPSFGEQGGAADAYLYRTLYENGVLDDAGGSLFIHNGCRVNSPGGMKTKPYSDLGYASKSGFQNAESLLMFTNAVGVAARAKVFYDKPRGMTKAMKSGHFGAGWKAYFTTESNDAGLATNVSGSKRTYTWSLNGDWTLDVRGTNGLGILGVSSNKLADRAVHPDHAWAGGWNFSNSAGVIQGAGRLSGGSRDEFVITSNWGIGILYWDGHEWRSRVTKPNDTWFGQWRYNAKVNSGKDKIRAVADFDGDGKDEILVTSSWGIGILERSGSTMTSLVAKPKGTRFGGWNYNTKDQILGTGDFNGDGKDDIVVRSGWGIGILTRSGNTFTSLMLKPKGTRFGGWNYSGSDVIEGIGDTDGDGKDELVIRSGWGIGVLRLAGSSLTTAVIKPKGTHFGGWNYDPGNNRVRAIADFDGDGKDDLLVTSSWGIGILERAGSSFTASVAKPNDTWFGSWRYNAKVNSGKDKILGAADLSGNGKAEILVRSSWGTGVLRLSGSSLYATYAKPHGHRVGAWHMSSKQKFAAVGNFDGKGGQEVLFEAK